MVRNVVRLAGSKASAQIFCLVMIGASATYSISMLGPLQEAIRLSLSLSDRQIAILQGPALYLPSILLAVPLGYTLDRVPRALLLKIFVLLQLGAAALTGLAPGFLALCASRVVAGTMLSAIAMAVTALIGGWATAAWRSRALMILAFCQVAGMSAAFSLGGILLRSFAHSPESWRPAALYLCAPLVLVLILALGVAEPPQSRHGDTDMSFWRRNVLGLWRLRAMVIPLAFGPVVVSVGYMAALVWAAPILTRTFALAPDEVGKTVGAILIVSAVAGPLAGGFLGDRVGRLRGPRGMVSMLLALAVLEIPAGLFGLMPTARLFILLLTTLATIFFMKGIVCASVTLAVVPDELRGSCFGIQNALNGIFASASPVMVISLSSRMAGADALGGSLAVICVVTSMLGAMVFAFARPYFASTSGQCMAVPEISTDRPA